MAIGKPTGKAKAEAMDDASGKKMKINPVQGFNDEHGRPTVPGEHAMGENSNLLPGSDHDIETTAVPGTKGSYNSDIGIVIPVDPLEDLEQLIKIGLISNSETLFKTALITMRAKNKDYAGSNDAEKAMKNFKTSAAVANIKMSKGILVRLMDKMTRIGNIIDSGEIHVKNESIYDTLQDAINYSAILYYGLLMEQRDALVKQKETMEAYREEKGD